MPILQVHQADLHYESHGQGAPLLLVHGLGSSLRDWERQVPFFAPRYRVLTIDLRGHGGSSISPGPYSSGQFADDLAVLVHALDIAPVHVVGLSLGGFIACQLAADHAELVRTLVMVNSVPALPRDTRRDRLRVAWSVLMRGGIARYLGMRNLGRFLGRKLFPDDDQTLLRQTFVDRWADNDRQAYLWALAIAEHWDLRDRLDEINCPTALIAGEHDFFPLSLKRRYVAELPDAELILIPGSRHFTPLDAADRFNRALGAFLAERG